jgi:hypothetical protein
MGIIQARTQTFLEGVQILFGEGFGSRLGPQSGPGQSPVRGPGGESPPEAEEI